MTPIFQPWPKTPRLFRGESDYGRGYREGFRAASGHYPGCPRLFAHMHGAAVCGECGATFRCQPSAVRRTLATPAPQAFLADLADPCVNYEDAQA